MKILRLIAVLILAAIMSACASGPKFTEVSASIPPLKVSQGRIYIYRNTTLGAGIRPDILVNGESIGTSEAMGFIFVDRVPGPMSVSTTSEVEKKATFNLDAGQTRYVKIDMGFGIIVWRTLPELVDNATGEREIRETSYSGRSAAKSNE